MHIIISIQHSDCLRSNLSAFYTKSKFKNDKKSKGAFEKHADNATSGGPILPKMSAVGRK